MLKKVLIGLAILAVLALIGLYGTSERMLGDAFRNEVVEPTPSVEVFEIEQAKDMTRENLEAKVRAMKDEILNLIWHGESTSLELQDGEVFYTYDAQKSKRATCERIGGRRPLYCDSWGAYQMKLSTIVHYWGEVYEGESITQKEALLVALDNDRARKFVEDCIFQVVGCVWEWYSIQDYTDFLTQRIPLIRELDAVMDR